MCGVSRKGEVKDTNSNMNEYLDFGRLKRRFSIWVYLGDRSDKGKGPYGNRTGVEKTKMEF